MFPVCASLGKFCDGLNRDLAGCMRQVPAVEIADGGGFRMSFGKKGVSQTQPPQAARAMAGRGAPPPVAARKPAQPLWLTLLGIAFLIVMAAHTWSGFQMLHGFLGDIQPRALYVLENVIEVTLVSWAGYTGAAIVLLALAGVAVAGHVRNGRS